MDGLRRELLRHLPGDGASRRLFHGRGGCFEGLEDLCIDWFAPVALVKEYRPRPVAFHDALVTLLRTLLPDLQAVLLQQRHQPGSPSTPLWGQLPAIVDAREDDLRFRLRLGAAQNVGLFLDMAVGRRLLRDGAAGKKLLNLFAYTCSLSVAALAGGARQVVNLDMNRGALELGRLNHTLNGLDLRRTSFLPMELFRSVGKLRRLGPFDLIVCDPPAAQGHSFTAERHWPKLVRLLPTLLTPHGEVLACLNARHLGSAYLDALFTRELPAARCLARLWPGEDFPERDPERGLVIHHYQLDPTGPR